MPTHVSSAGAPSRLLLLLPIAFLKLLLRNLLGNVVQVVIDRGCQFDERLDGMLVGQHRDLWQLGGLEMLDGLPLAWHSDLELRLHFGKQLREVAVLRASITAQDRTSGESESGAHKSIPDPTKIDSTHGNHMCEDCTEDANS